MLLLQFCCSDKSAGELKQVNFWNESIQTLSYLKFVDDVILSSFCSVASTCYPPGEAEISSVTLQSLTCLKG